MPSRKSSSSKKTHKSQSSSFFFKKDGITYGENYIRTNLEKSQQREFIEEFKLTLNPAERRKWNPVDIEMCKWSPIRNTLEKKEIDIEAVVYPSHIWAVVSQTLPSGDEFPYIIYRKRGEVIKKTEIIGYSEILKKKGELLLKELCPSDGIPIKKELVIKNLNDLLF